MVKDDDTHWINSGATILQLIGGCAAVVAVGVTLYLANRSDLLTNEGRITRLEVRSENGSKRNDTQDGEIERLRQIASSNQVLIGQLNARLDGIISQLTLISGRLENTRKEAWGVK